MKTQWVRRNASVDVVSGATLDEAVTHTLTLIGLGEPHLKLSMQPVNVVLRRCGEYNTINRV